MSPIKRYRALLKAGRLQPDKAQARAAQTLESLYRSLKDYRPRSRSIFGLAFDANGSSPPKGLYIHGDVGRGKSALMDMFFESAPTARKRRVHFNQFMTEIHQRIHEWRNLSQRERSRRPEFIRAAEDDLIAPVAKGIFFKARLLCLDEF
jgi:cell division protein ZapE